MNKLKLLLFVLTLICFCLFMYSFFNKNILNTIFYGVLILYNYIGFNKQLARCDVSEKEMRQAMTKIRSISYVLNDSTYDYEVGKSFGGGVCLGIEKEMDAIGNPIFVIKTDCGVMLEVTNCPYELIYESEAGDE